MKLLLLCLVLLLIPEISFSQKQISAQSGVFIFNNKPVYEKGDAPSLKCELLFTDVNDNNILDPLEKAKFELKITNSGKGKAQGLTFKLNHNFATKNVNITEPNEVFFIHPGKTIVVDIPIEADSLLIPQPNSLTVSIKEHFGYNPDTISLDLNPTYKRDLPPNLYADMSFEDANNNGILESREKGLLSIRITNKGDGKAQGLKLLINDNIDDSCFIINHNKVELVYLNANESVNIKIPIQAKANIETNEHKLSINVNEYFGYDMDPVMLILNTLEYQKPKIVYSGYDIIDYGEGTTSINEDGQLQLGEKVKLKLLIQNIGVGKALNAQYVVSSSNPNVYIDEGTGNIGTMQPGEVVELFVWVSPNKKVNTVEGLGIELTCTEKYSSGDLVNFDVPIVLNQKPPVARVINIEADVDQLTKKIARFEYTSKKFSTNVGRIFDITDIKPTSNKKTNSVAVVFGVEEYNNLPPAPYASNDADIFSKYLKERLGIEQIVLYKNSDVDGFIFDDVFDPNSGELQKAIIKGETELFVFYSGHGVPSKDGKNIYLFPSDGRIDRLEKQGYNINDLYTSLDELGAKNTTVFIDACFSGASRTSEKVKIENLVAQKGVKINPKYQEPWQTNPNFNVFNSSGPNETSLGFDPSNTGLFTYYLCVGLQGEADENKDRKITNGELDSYISSQVQETSKKIFGLQSPQFNGNKDQVILEY